jgi:hypothetical protein
MVNGIFNVFSSTGGRQTDEDKNETKIAVSV